MYLEEFVLEKTRDLKESYRSVELDKTESVVLSQNSVAEEFNSKETPLEKKGKEVNLSEIDRVSSTPFVPNGTLLRFAVKPPRKRKSVSKDFYFMWED